MKGVSGYKLEISSKKFNWKKAKKVFSEINEKKVYLFEIESRKEILCEDKGL